VSNLPACCALAPPAAQCSCRREACTGRSAWLPLGRACLSAWIEHRPRPPLARRIADRRAARRLQKLAADPKNEALRQQALRNVADLRLHGMLAANARGSAAFTPLAKSIIYTFFAVFCTLFRDFHCRSRSAFSLPMGERVRRLAHCHSFVG